MKYSVALIFLFLASRVDQGGAFHIAGSSASAESFAPAVSKGSTDSIASAVSSALAVSKGPADSIASAVSIASDVSSAFADLKGSAKSKEGPAESSTKSECEERASAEARGRAECEARASAFPNASASASTPASDHLVIARSVTELPWLKETISSNPRETCQTAEGVKRAGEYFEAEQYPCTAMVCRVYKGVGKGYPASCNFSMVKEALKLGCIGSVGDAPFPKCCEYVVSCRQGVKLFDFRRFMKMQKNIPDERDKNENMEA